MSEIAQARTFDEFMEGIWRQNPVFVMVLGMCPVLAVSVSLVLPGAFDRHMMGMSGTMGMMGGDHDMDSLFQGFRSGVYDALLLSALAASVAAISASLCTWILGFCAKVSP